MNCPRCNHTFEGDTCPICYTKVVPLNQTQQGFSSQDQSTVLKTCSHCNHQFVGTYCPLCGSNSTVKNTTNVAYNINGGKCLRCGGVTNTNTCPHCGYTHPVSSGYLGGNNTTNANGYANQRPNNNQYNQNQYNPNNPYGNQYNNGQNGYGYGYAPPMQKQKKSILLPAVMIAFASILVLSTLALMVFSMVDFGNNGNTGNEPPVINGIVPPKVNNTESVNYPDGVSLEEYKKIKIGMEYAQVSAIIGGDGQIISSEKGESKKTVYAWYGQNIQDAIITIAFEDNKVTKIEQQNLF